MTLSNFDWTDKDSVKWFVLLPTGHEGPYALDYLSESLSKKKIHKSVKVWAEGLAAPVSLGEALERSEPLIEEEPEIPPPLPPLPEEVETEEEAPTIPVQEEPEIPEATPEVPVTEKKKINPLFYWAPALIIVGVMFAYLFRELTKRYEVFDIRRHPKMTLEMHEKIKSDFDFEGWNKKIFFKEYLPDDHSHIWLVTSGFQNCKVEASFESVDNKLLSIKEEKVAFKTQGELVDHVAEFSRFDFSQGSKIIPGMYEMDVKASDCKWSGFVPKLMNRFKGPDATYVGRTKVVLFSKGPQEFGQILDRLIQKKMEKVLKEQNKKELFWQDLQQKLETLQAVTLQIEQLFLDFLGKGNRDFKSNLRPTIDRYTKQFGSFLTSFVVENEKYFKSLDKENLAGITQFKTYESMVNHTSKKIGFESMKYIEEMQGIKGKPRNSYLRDLTERMKETYSKIKLEIAQKIIQVSEDRSQ